MKEPNKPRTFSGVGLIVYHEDGEQVQETFDNELNLIEKSHADALEQRVKELEAEAVKKRERFRELIAEQSELKHKALKENAELTRKLAILEKQRNDLAMEACDMVFGQETFEQIAALSEILKPMDAELNGATDGK